MNINQLRPGDLVKVRLKGEKESSPIKGRIILVDKDKITVKTKSGSIMEFDKDYIIEKYGRDYTHLANVKRGWRYDETYHKFYK